MTLDITVLIALTIGVIEILKGFEIPTRFIPLLAIVIGVIASVVSNIAGALTLDIFTGIGIGLASCGLFDFGKKTIIGK